MLHLVKPFPLVHPYFIWPNFFIVPHFGLCEQYVTFDILSWLKLEHCNSIPQVSWCVFIFLVLSQFTAPIFFRNIVWAVYCCLNNITSLDILSSEVVMDIFMLIKCCWMKLELCVNAEKCVMYLERTFVKILWSLFGNHWNKLWMDVRSWNAVVVFLYVEVLLGHACVSSGLKYILWNYPLSQYVFSFWIYIYIYIYLYLIKSSTTNNLFCYLVFWWGQNMS